MNHRREIITIKLAYGIMLAGIIWILITKFNNMDTVFTLRTRIETFWRPCVVVLIGGLIPFISKLISK